MKSCHVHSIFLPSSIFASYITLFLSVSLVYALPRLECFGAQRYSSLSPPLPTVEYPNGLNTAARKLNARRVIKGERELARSRASYMQIYAFFAERLFIQMSGCTKYARASSGCALVPPPPTPLFSRRTLSGPVNYIHYRGICGQLS